MIERLLMFLLGFCISSALWLFALYLTFLTEPNDHNYESKDDWRMM